MRSRLLVLIPLTAVLGSCAARTLPTRFPNGSAASPHSREAPRARVVTTLDGDPPLPGEPAGDWAGLEQATPTSNPSHKDH
jgi:hypothetical protein